MQIRTVRLGDTEALLALIQDHALFEQGMATITKQTLDALLQLPDLPTHIWIADEDGAVGYAALTFDYALWSGTRFGHLDCLFVSAFCRGRGIGEMLFRAVAEATRNAGAAYLEWQTPSWNTDAVKFYVRQGAASKQ